MGAAPAADDSRGRALRGIAAVSAGMVLFALCAHQGPPWIAAGACGFAVTAGTIGWSRRHAAGPAAILGLETPSRRTAALCVLGCAVGAGAGLTHRTFLGLPLVPDAGIEPFVAVACLVGAAEELVYRGWLFGTARTFGAPAAVAIAAAAHAAYKTALFAWPADPAAVDLAVLAAWTLVGGAVLGLLRALSSSVLPPLLAHAAFDFVVYRSVAHAPWWVWD